MRISFIVPTRNSASTLEACLGSIRTQRHDDKELIVVDNASVDDTRLIALRYADEVFEHGPDRCAQRNAGATRATGDVLVFIDPDTTLEPGIARQIAERLDRSPDVGALVIPERSHGHGFLAACRGLERSLRLRTPGAEPPRVFRVEVFDKVGGWAEELMRGEELELADRVRSTGTQIDRVDAFAWRDEGRVTLRGTFREQAELGRRIARCLNEHVRDGGLRSVRALLRRPRHAARHPAHTVGLLVLKSAEAVGLAVGLLRWRREGRVR